MEISIENRLPKEVVPEVLTTPKTVWAKIAEIGWGPAVRDLVAEAVQGQKEDQDGYCYTVVYDKTEPLHKIAGFAVGSVKEVFYVRMIYAECPPALYLASCQALNAMVQAYMDALFSQLGARGPLIHRQRNELDNEFGSGKSYWGNN
jgi:hypothetical protein